MKLTHARSLGRLVSLATLLVVVSSLVAGPVAYGELLFSDSFDYPAGDLGGQGPPPGSPPGQGGWVTIAHTPNVGTMGLDFPGILTAGASALLQAVPSQNSDEASAALGPVTPDMGVVWIGFLMRKARPPQAGGGGFAVVAAIGPSITDPSVGIGMIFTKNRYGLDNDTGNFGSRALTSVPTNSNTV